MKFNCDQCGTRYSIADSKVERKILRIRCKVCDYIMTVRGSDMRAHETVGISVSLSGSAVLPPDHVEWYAAPKNRQIGPMSLDEMIAAIERREVEPETLVWNGTMDNWHAAQRLDELSPHFDPPEVPRSMPPPLPLLKAKTAADEPTDSNTAESPINIDMSKLLGKSPDDEDRDTHQYAPDFNRHKVEATELGLIERDTDVQPPILGSAVDDEPEATARLTADALLKSSDFGSPDEASRDGDEPDDGSVDMISSDLLESIDSMEVLDFQVRSMLPPSSPAASDGGGQDDESFEGIQTGSDVSRPEPPSSPKLVSIDVEADESKNTDSEDGMKDAVPTAEALAPSNVEPVVPPNVELNIADFASPVAAPSDVSKAQPKTEAKSSGLPIAMAIMGIAAIGCIVWYASSSRTVATNSVKSNVQTVATTKPSAQKPKTIPTPVVDAAIAKDNDVTKDASVSKPDAAPPKSPKAKSAVASKTKTKVDTQDPSRKVKTAVIPKAQNVGKKARKIEPKPETKPAGKMRPSSLFTGKHGPSAVLPSSGKKKAESASSTSGNPGLSQGEIKEYIKKYARSLNGCVQRQLKKGRLPVKKLLLSFDIRPTGRTSNVSIGKKYEDKFRVLSSCLKASVRRWIFPRFEGQPIPIEYPIILGASY